MAATLRSHLAPDGVNLEFGLKVSGTMSWFFAKAQSEGTIKVTLTWGLGGEASGAVDEAPATEHASGEP